MDVQKFSKFWLLRQTILMLQMSLETLQFIWHHVKDIQKLSKSWPLWQRILMLKQNLDELRDAAQNCQNFVSFDKKS